MQTKPTGGNKNKQRDTEQTKPQMDLASSLGGLGKGTRLTFKTDFLRRGSGVTPYVTHFTVDTPLSVLIKSNRTLGTGGAPRAVGKQAVSAVLTLRLSGGPLMSAPVALQAGRLVL